jgi:hypothetical protein
VDPSVLAAWTPVALNLTTPTPSIDWGDLRGVRFIDPFFQQTVERWAGAAPQPLLRTGLDGLATLDSAPSLDPDGLVFHLSRCGSTLVSRLLSTIPGTVVVSEPPPINSLLMMDMNDDALVPLLRSMIRALGRRRFGDERHFVLKLSSWNTRRIGLFRHAFPGVPVIWVQRTPLDVMASLLRDPPGWAKLQQFPAQLGSIFGIAPDQAAQLDRPRFYAQALTAMLHAIHTTDDGPMLALDYRMLPEAIWTAAARFLGLGLGDADIARMREEARYSSKSMGHRPFARPTDARRDMPEAVCALVEQCITPLYEAIARKWPSVPA